MNEYIELINRLRQEAEFEAYLQPHSANETPKLLSEAADVIEELSKERKKGKWKLAFTEEENVYECSVCGELFLLNDGTPYDNAMRYCPRCGAKLLEG